MGWFSHLLNDVLTAIVLLFIVVIALLRNDTILGWVVQWILDHYRGPIGEWVVNDELRKLPKEYILLKDVLIPRADDPARTTQVDHVVLSPHGVFVLETKNIGGKLVAGDSYAEWVVRKGRRSYKMRNPARQNYLHIQSLRHILGVDDAYPIQSIVVFSNRANLKAVKSRTAVVHFAEVRPQILKMSSNGSVPAEIVQRYRMLLEQATIHGRKAREKHVRDIEIAIEKRNHAKTLKGKEGREPAIEPTECAHEAMRSSSVNEQGVVHDGEMGTLPAAVLQSADDRFCSVCGAAMVPRNGKRGAFWGCSRFPKCRYTESE